MWAARAAILRRVGAPMTIETLQVGPLAAGDVLVRVRAASLCHTDLEAIEGALSVQLPVVLGHEAAGEVAALGSEVTDLAVGDHVVLSWNPHCGRCFYCERAQPITIAISPHTGRAIRVAAPTPVITPHPISAARSNGMASGTRIALCAGTTQSSENPPKYIN